MPYFFVRVNEFLGEEGLAVAGKFGLLHCVALLVAPPHNFWNCLPARLP